MKIGATGMTRFAFIVRIFRCDATTSSGGPMAQGMQPQAWEAKATAQHTKPASAAYSAIPDLSITFNLSEPAAVLFRYDLNTYFASAGESVYRRRAHRERRDR